MNKIGFLGTEGGGGTVYKDGDSYIFHYDGISLTKEGKEYEFSGVSEKFPSMEALREYYKGFAFKPEGSSEWDLTEYLKRSAANVGMIEEMREMAAERRKQQ